MYLREPRLPRPVQRPGPGLRRTCCLIASLHPERGLGHALAQHLAGELPELDFVLGECPEVDAVWLCGYELGQADFVRAWRARYPLAVLLVTGRGSAEEWTGEALAAGADHALPWPVELKRLARLLHGRRLVRRA